MTNFRPNLAGSLPLRGWIMNKQTQGAAQVPTKKSVTRGDAERAVLGLAVARGRNRALAALMCFGVDNLARLHPSKYGALVTVCRSIQEATKGARS